MYSDGGVGASEACVAMALASVKKIISQLQPQPGCNKSSTLSSNCSSPIINGAAPIISSIPVETTTAEEIISTNLSNHCSLLIMPGGRDLPYVKKLQGKGNRNISDFVRNGGSYLGICAGAYYGCSLVQFAQGDPLLEVVGPRELAFFPGVSQGPVFAGFDYASSAGAKAADIELTQAGSEMLDLYDRGENATTSKSDALSNHDVTSTSSTSRKNPNGASTCTPLQIYCNGGCHFIDDSLSEDTTSSPLTTPTSLANGTPPIYKVLATYAASNEQFSTFVSPQEGPGAVMEEPLSAIIAGCYSKGRVILSGVHFEASAELLKKHYEDDPYIEVLQPHIASSDPGREKLLSACIKYLLNL